jgi:RHS repeat-associated protein
VDGAGVVIAAHVDALQSVRALTDATGTITQTYQRDPFGIVGAVDGSSTQPFDFTGEIRDAETGFVYLRSRMYDPQSGRFISRDGYGGSAAHPQTQNRYSYAGNNPVTFADPTGHCVVCGLFQSAMIFAAAVMGAGANQPIKLANGQWVSPAAPTPTPTPAPGPAPAPVPTPSTTSSSLPAGGVSTIVVGGTIPAPLNRNFTQAMDAEVQEEGSITGCAVRGPNCLETESGLPSERWIRGHREAVIANRVRIALGDDPIPGTLQPECVQCSAEFGGQMSNLGKFLKIQRLRGNDTRDDALRP